MTVARLRVALIAISLGCLVGSPTAVAATWHGVVIAKDLKRHTFVTVSGGVVRTVRTSTRYRAIGVGARVRVRAKKLADGTYAVSALRTLGRDVRARFVGVVVQRTSNRLLLSAGGSVVAVTTAGFATAAVSDGASPAPGDQVDVAAKVESSGLEAPAGGVHTIAHTDMVVVEGFFSAASADRIDVAITNGGVVQVAVPPGIVLPEFHQGDEIVVVAAVDAMGRLVWLKGQVVHRPAAGSGTDTKPTR